ncbi:MAG: aminoacyl-tRNA hydrolase [Candidatus Aegiribacteria sp.]|nr:aminoacyl-tRNA hydrolase [Candidatus Aegiribacteria sp.]
MSVPRLVACLGNPGEKYKITWHNAGFWVADILAREAGVHFINAGLFNASVIPEGPDLIKPTVYMNRSGKAVAAFLDSRGYNADELLVVCDDTNLELGRLRLRDSGSHGGHNGLKSIIDSLGTESFSRLRLGIGPPPSGDDLADYVLDKVPEKLEEEASVMAHKAADCVMLYLTEGLTSAQERYNRKQNA